MWDAQARELSASFRVLRYDQRGHGKTEAPAGRYTFDLLIADALALMDALEVERRISVACRWAARPRSVSRSNIRTASTASSSATRLASRRRSRRSNGRSASRSARKDGMEPLVEPTVGRWFPPNVPKQPAHLDQVRAMIRGTPVDGFIGCAAALADHDYAAAVATVKRPVLFVAGEKDGGAPPAMRKLIEALAGLALRRASRRRAHFQSRPAGGFHEGGGEFPENRLRARRVPAH